MKKNYEPEDLIDFIESEVRIECSNCHTVSGQWFEDEEYFFYEGWRATKNNVYCPTCAKKKLKL